MARKTQPLSGIFARAERENQPAANQPEAGDNADLDEGRIISVGVGIREGEEAAYTALAERLGVKKNKIMRIALSYFIVKVRAGEINPEDYLEDPPKPEKKARLPR